MTELEYINKQLQILHRRIDSLPVAANLTALAEVINHSGSITLSSGLGYLGNNWYNAQAYNVKPTNSGATNSAALQALVDYAASTGPGVIYFPYHTDHYQFAKVGTSPGGVGYAILCPNPVDSLWFIGYGAKLQTAGVVNATAASHFCLFLVEGLILGEAKSNIHWLGLDLSGTNDPVTAGLYPDNRGLLILGQYVSDCTVEQCQAHHFFSAGFGAFVGGQGYRLSIQNCKAYENGENGINWNVQEGGQIINNLCWDNTTGGIEASVTKSVVTGNQCWGNLRGIAIGGFTVPTDEGVGNVVHSNIARDNQEYGLAISSGTRQSVFGQNNIYRNGDGGINVVEDTVTYPGVYTSGNVISNNLIYSNGSGDGSDPVGKGIYVNAASNSFYHNIILPGSEVGFTQHIGILLENNHCDNSQLVGNYVSGHTITDYILNTQSDLVADLQPQLATRDVNSSVVATATNRSIYSRIASGASFDAIPTDELLWVFSAPTTINLPLASEYPQTTPLYIKDKQGTAATNNITIQTSGADTIESYGASITINTNYGSAILLSDGTSGWYIM